MITANVCDSDAYSSVQQRKLYVTAWNNNNGQNDNNTNTKNLSVTPSPTTSTPSSTTPPIIPPSLSLKQGGTLERWERRYVQKYPQKLWLLVNPTVKDSLEKELDDRQISHTDIPEPGCKCPKLVGSENDYVGVLVTLKDKRDLEMLYNMR